VVAILEVKLLHATSLMVAIEAIRKCWDSIGRSDSLYQWNLECEKSYFILGEKDTKLIRNVIAKGHDSTLEHIVFSFDISGISRACSHQLVRHRMASYSQRSQRYVSEDEFEYVVPSTISSNNNNAMGEYLNTMLVLNQSYQKLKELGIPKEDARFVLPNACETSLIMTINARSLRNFFKLRMDKHAQWEIRELAMEMYNQIKNEYGILFEDVMEGLKSAN
jgi:thymidylate synthase (FAD)